MATLPLDGIVDVSVVVSPVIQIRSSFNTALILGNSTVLTTVERVADYNNLSEMIVDGFATDDPEYVAASLYFAQNPKPSKVFVGVVGTEETLLEALTACRESNSEWYVAVPVDTLVNTLTQEEVVALSAYIEACTPSSVLALSLNVAGTYVSILTALKSGSYSRTIAMYDNVVANTGKTPVAGIIGYAMGANKDGAQAYTLAYKTIVGIEAVTSLTSVDLTELLGLNGNVYINQATNYNLFRQGKMSNGVSFDEVLYLDMLVEQIKSNVMFALTTSLKIPQTNAGLNTLTDAIADACELSVASGFLAPGVWTGPAILNLNTNDALSRGYLVQFAPLVSQSQADREARIAPNCYVAVKTAGAIEHVVISVTVNR